MVIDVTNGDILAMVSMPCYDPNSFSDGISHSEWDMMAQDERHPLINKVLGGLYPPGSTCKPMNALALLGAGVDPDERVVCDHSYPVGNAIFHCDTTHGPIAMKDAVSRSCDIYFYHMARRVGIQTLAPMMRNMGYGQRFDLPFPSQRFGTVPDPAWLQRREHRDWAEYDTINISIGQGYLIVNPLQQAMQVARIASGRMLHPRLLAETPVNLGEPLPVTPEHLAFIRSAMEATVNGNGTARAAKLPIDNVLMGGKTGTAQVRRITDGGARRRRAIEQQPGLAYARPQPFRRLRADRPAKICYRGDRRAWRLRRERRGASGARRDDIFVRQGPGDGRACAARGAMGRQHPAADGPGDAGLGGAAARGGWAACAGAGLMVVAVQPHSLSLSPRGGLRSQVRPPDEPKSGRNVGERGAGLWPARGFAAHPHPNPSPQGGGAN